jgi:hypothetical protein
MERKQRQVFDFPNMVLMVLLWEGVFGSAYGASAIPNDTTEKCKWMWIYEITVDHGPCVQASLLAPVMSWYTTMVFLIVFPFLPETSNTSIIVYRRLPKPLRRWMPCGKR